MSGANGQRYQRLVIQNAMVINGSGTPAGGPIDVVIEDGRITDLVKVDAMARAGYGPDWQRPTGDMVLDAAGMYVLPGLVEMHTHVPIDASRAGPGAWDYFYKLMLGHGITAIRTCGFGGESTLFEHRAAAQADSRLPVPRLVIMHPMPRGQFLTPDEARAKVREYHALGADGIKLIDPDPDTFEAICDEARALRMPAGTAAHLSLSCPIDAVRASAAGVTTIEHTYGIPEAAIPGVQAFPPDYNEVDELVRFRQSGYHWTEADRYPERVIDVLDAMIGTGTAWSPTFATYEANRDIVRAQNSPHYAEYASPVLLRNWAPNPTQHASFHFDWKTADEIAWKEKYRIWFKYVRSFSQRGGTVTVGADAGFQYTLYGFSMIREMELFQEAGFHPLDVIRLATTSAAKVAGLPLGLQGGVRRGYLADLAVVDGNPLDNFKVMYGTGMDRYSPDRMTSTRAGGVRWTVRDGVLFDAREMLADAAAYVRREKERLGQA